MKRAVVVFSGGQDSTTCLIQALTQYEDIHCVTFDYGQRHREEINIAKDLASKLGSITHKIIDVGLLKTLVVSSLTCKNMLIPHYQEEQKALPSTFVPGRNILFMTLAAIYASQVDSEAVITGVCETDFSGYPDCRDKFIKAFNQAVNLGMTRNLLFITPLMWLNKAEIWAMADYHQQLECIRNDTLTCYNGIIGDGCGQCAACNLRAKGLKSYQQQPEAIMAAMKFKTGI